jgi:hypothetical protein
MDVCVAGASGDRPVGGGGFGFDGSGALVAAVDDAGSGFAGGVVVGGVGLILYSGE